MIEIKENHSPIFENSSLEETKRESFQKSFDTTSANTDRSAVIEKIMPHYKNDMPYSVSIYNIVNSYTKSCQKHKFIITEQTPTACTAYYTQQCSVKTLLNCCLGKKSKKKVTSARLIIGTNSRSQLRTIYIKGLFGDSNLISKLIGTFKSIIETTIKPPEEGKYQQVEDEEDAVITCKNESYSYYQFYKILSCEAYSLGKSVTDFCESFKSQYRNAAESSQLLPQPLHSIQATVEHTIESLFSHYNYGKKNAEKVMVYCRPAVEKYIFTKLQAQLMQIYQVKYFRQDNIVGLKRKAMEGMNLIETMRYVGVPEKFWLSKEENSYEETLEIFKKINECITPSEKLNCLLSVEASMKTCVVQYWKGQVELDADSALLVAKFIILKSNASSPHAEIALISDYLGDKYEDERAVVRNFELSLLFLTN